MRACRSPMVLMALLLMLLLGGCGKKGKLYLPDQPRPAATANGQAAPGAVLIPEDEEPSLPSATAAP